MANTLEKKIEHSLLAGKSKQQTLDDLRQQDDAVEIISILNDLSYPGRRQKILAANIFLILSVLTITGRQLFVAFQDGFVSPLLLILSMIVPSIHLYLLKKIFRFQKMGYQFMGILAALALIRPENRLPPNLYLYLIIAALSGLLFFFLFPKNEQLT